MRKISKAFILLLSCALPVAAAPKKPNIIFIMTDDQGYGDLSCHGHPYLKTPNLDKLHSQSTRFTDYHVSPTCAPTRAAVMSGRLPFAVGVSHTIVERERMALNVPTIADVLKKAGYTTGIFGKWHLGEEDEYQPHNRGFDEVFIHGAGGIGQQFAGSQADAPGTSYFNPIIRHNTEFVQTEGYCADVFFQHALGWIKDNKEKKDKPFYAYIATNTPHSPFIVGDEYMELTEGDAPDKKTQAFLGMVANIDVNVGILMKKLDEWDLADNTLLVFTTDNGTSRGFRVYNADMKGYKGSLHEGGSRVPLFLRLPGLTKAKVDIEGLARHIDIFPTLAELAGADISDLGLRGRSLLPLVKNPKAKWEDRHTFFHGGRWPKKGAPGKFGVGSPNPDDYKFKKYALRSEKWRLVNGELYDITRDPSEEKDVSKRYPEVVEKMTKIYSEEWDRLRPLLVNEDASLKVPKPYKNAFLKQKKGKGIPQWKAPEL